MIAWYRASWLQPVGNRTRHRDSCPPNNTLKKGFMVASLTPSPLGGGSNQRLTFYTQKKRCFAEYEPRIPMKLAEKSTDLRHDFGGPRPTAETQIPPATRAPDASLCCGRSAECSPYGLRSRKRQQLCPLQQSGPGTDTKWCPLDRKHRKNGDLTTKNNRI